MEKTKKVSYKYDRIDKYLADDELLPYMNQLGEEGWNIFNVKSGGTYIKGKLRYILLCKKEYLTV